MDEKAVKLPTFNGKSEGFEKWWMRFKAYAQVYKFVQALQKEDDLPATESTEIDESSATGKKQAMAKKRNALAMACFTMSFTSDGLLGMINESMTSEWPSGLAYLVVEALNKEYRPMDRMTRVDLRTDLNNIHMKKKDKPSVLFEQIAHIKNRYNRDGFKISEEDLFAVVMAVAPDEYQSNLISEQRTKGEDLTLQNLRQVMDTVYRQLYGVRKSKQDENEPEVSLSNFAGRCFTCKQRGHKASQCPKGQQTQQGQQQNQANSNAKQQICGHCGKKGHNESNCWLKPENRDKAPNWLKAKLDKKEVAAGAIEGTIPEFLLAQPKLSYPKEFQILLNPNIFIADSACSAHSTGHKLGIVDLKPVKQGSAFVLPNGALSEQELYGKLPVTVCDKFAHELWKATIGDIKYVPNQMFNLLSTTKLSKDGWIPGGDKTALWFTKNGQKLLFDIEVKTGEGAIYAACLKRRQHEVGAAGVEVKQKISVLKAHQLLGHINEEATRKTAKILGWDLKPGSLGVCESCTVAKAKQKNVPKVSEHIPSNIPNERIYLDIATVKQMPNEPRITRPHWRIMVDECTQMKFSNFFETKNGMIEPTCIWLDKWRQNGKPVKFIRLDNAGENKGLQSRSISSDWKLNIEYEFTASDTPQQNHLAELGFAVLANRGRAMMYAANIPKDIRRLVFREAFQTATLLDGLVPIILNDKLASRYHHWSHGKQLPFANYLRTWGEAGTVKTKTGMMSKLDDRGVPCMFVGYALNHAGDCYRMWDPATRRVHETRDVIWLNRMYYAKNPTTEEDNNFPLVDFIDTVADPDVSPLSDDKDVESPEAGEGMDNASTSSSTASNSNESEMNESETLENAETEATGNPTDTASQELRTQSGRVITKPARFREMEAMTGQVAFDEVMALATNYQMKLSQAEQIYYETMKDCPDNEHYELSCVGAGIGGGFDKTQELHVMKYDEAMTTPDKEKWKQAVDEEHDRMVKHGVFEPVPVNKIPADTKVISSTWAMKKKSNGVYRARLAARGFEQIDGVHYDSNSKSSPVVTQATIRIFFILAIMAHWAIYILDVRGAFLHGEFEDGEQIYMKVPQGFEKFYPGNVQLKLRKTLYGLIQAALAFWRKLVLVFISIGFKRSKADPCLFYKWTKEGLILWISFIDDLCGAGPILPLLQSKDEVMNIFDCDEVGPIKEYVGCKVEYKPNDGMMKLTQPVLLQSLKDEFNLPEEIVSTPAAAGEVLSKDTIDTSPHEQFTYRSGVGKLIHMMQWTRPEIRNAVRDLTKFMAACTSKHFASMKRVMAYLVQTPNRGLLLKPKTIWNGNPNFPFVISGRADSDYAKDPDTRRSVSGYSTFLCGAPVTEKSTIQRCVTLSVTEAETVSATSCAQDMLFIMRLLESIGLQVQKPMILEIDNKGAKDNANNWSVGGRTRHVEVREHFLRDLKEDGLINVLWIPTDENSSDLFTKNLSGPTFEKHTAIYCGHDEYMQYI